MVSSTTFGAVTLKTDAREEFKVNGQRLKHYLSREKEKEELQLENYEREGSKQQVQLGTQNIAGHGRQPV